MDLERVLKDLSGSLGHGKSEKSDVGISWIKSSAWDRETLLSALQVVYDRLKRSDEQILTLKAQLELTQGPSDWKQRYETQHAEWQSQEAAVLHHLEDLEQELSIATEAVLSKSAEEQTLRKETQVLERKNRELQKRCDEYYSELQELRRAYRRETAELTNRPQSWQTDVPSVKSVSWADCYGMDRSCSTLHLSQLRNSCEGSPITGVVRRTDKKSVHARKHSSCI